MMRLEEQIMYQIKHEKNIQEKLEMVWPLYKNQKNGPENSNGYPQVYKKERMQ